MSLPRNGLTSAPRPRRRRPSRDRSPDADARNYERLRGLLVGPEHARIGNLEERTAAIIGTTAETVGDVLPEATANATTARERDLAVALEPAVTTALGSMAQTRPEVIGDILAPTIGTAVRKAVAEAIAAMLERFNEALDRSFSIRSLKWRIEAAHTGRPYAEVVLLRTLRYRVEQVFLIHATSSLVLQHVVDPSLQAQAPDQVAAMLAAIDSFGREALGSKAEDAHLDRFEFGDLVVWIDRDPQFVLTAVTRGAASVEIGRQLREVRERVALTYRKELMQFDGDPTLFDPARPALETLLRTEREPPPQRAHVWLGLAALLVVAGVAGVVFRAQSSAAAATRARASLIQAFASEPGFVLTSAEWSRRRGRVAGFRDPIAPTPETVLARHGLRGVTTQFAPFVSLDPRVVEQRIQRVLSPPPSATVRFSEGTLRISGVAPRAWIDEARVVGRSQAGIEHYDDTGLRSAETLDALRGTKSALDSIAIHFAAGKTGIAAAEETNLHRAADTAKRALALAHEARLGACLEVTGRADAPGTAEQNAALSEARAASVTARLAELGVAGPHIRARGAGNLAAERSRSVGFRFETSEQWSDCEGAP